jgi:hypothetical protein
MYTLRLATAVATSSFHAAQRRLWLAIAATAPHNFLHSRHLRRGFQA